MILHQKLTDISAVPHIAPTLQTSISRHPARWKWRLHSVHTMLVACVFLFIRSLPAFQSPPLTNSPRAPRPSFSLHYTIYAHSCLTVSQFSHAVRKKLSIYVAGLALPTSISRKVLRPHRLGVEVPDVSSAPLALLKLLESEWSSIPHRPGGCLVGRWSESCVTSAFLGSVCAQCFRFGYIW
jgi:hypothetical protein